METDYELQLVLDPGIGYSLGDKHWRRLSIREYFVSYCNNIVVKVMATVGEMQPTITHLVHTMSVEGVSTPQGSNQ